MSQSKNICKSTIFNCRVNRTAPQASQKQIKKTSQLILTFQKYWFCSCSMLTHPSYSITLLDTSCDAMYGSNSDMCTSSLSGSVPEVSIQFLCTTMKPAWSTMKHLYIILNNYCIFLVRKICQNSNTPLHINQC